GPDVGRGPAPREHHREQEDSTRDHARFYPALPPGATAAVEPPLLLIAIFLFLFAQRAALAAAARRYSRPHPQINLAVLLPPLRISERGIDGNKPNPGVRAAPPHGPSPHAWESPSYLALLSASGFRRAPE